jgi:hypothetical protein
MSTRSSIIPAVATHAAGLVTAVAEPYGVGIPAEDTCAHKQIGAARSGSASRAAMIDRTFAALRMRIGNSP